MATTQFESIVDYTTILNNFEGPLDLLLYLVKESRIEIRDMFVSEVTEQFINYVRQTNMENIEKASEYLSMAATLLEIKSKALLPKIEMYDDDTTAEDLEKLVIQQVEEYKILKEASEKLKKNETTDVFFKEPEKGAKNVRIVYTDFNKEGLIKAFFEMLSKSQLKKSVEQSLKSIPKEVFTVEDKVRFVSEEMLIRKECKFFDLFTEYTTKSEMITTFQAILELLKLQYISIIQEENYGEITLILREDRRDINGDLEQLSEYN